MKTLERNVRPKKRIFGSSDYSNHNIFNLSLHICLVYMPIQKTFFLFKWNRCIEIWLMCKFMSARRLKQSIYIKSESCQVIYLLTRTLEFSCYCLQVSFFFNNDMVMSFDITRMYGETLKTILKCEYLFCKKLFVFN